MVIYKTSSKAQNGIYNSLESKRVHYKASCICAKDDFSKFSKMTGPMLNSLTLDADVNGFIYFSAGKQKVIIWNMFALLIFFVLSILFYRYNNVLEKKVRRTVRKSVMNHQSISITSAQTLT